MATRLLLAGKETVSERISRFVPPSCRPPAHHELVWQQRGDLCEYCLDLGAIEPAASITDPAGLEVLPSFSAQTRAPYGFQIALEWTESGAVQSVPLSPIGAPIAAFNGDEAPNAPVRSLIDYFAIDRPLSRAQIRLRAGPASSLAGAPCLLTASVRAPDSAAPATGSSTGRANVDVPALTQMIDPQLGPRLCSPTSVTMVISHFGGDADLLEVAHAAYHPAHDLYGVWPAALYAASRHGLLGYLLRFPDWATARWLLEHQVPIVASIRYGRDQLPGAAVPKTKGHLVVVRGFEGDSVLVNDPAAPAPSQVPRAYPLESFLRAWLGGSGVGYVLFPGADDG